VVPDPDLLFFRMLAAYSSRCRRNRRISGDSDTSDPNRFENGHRESRNGSLSTNTPNARSLRVHPEQSETFCVDPNRAGLGWYVPGVV
jgi:hypothetical protein